jgi:acetyl-CoA acetyltransferase
VVLGAALQQGAQGFNLARQSALAAGLPYSVAGMTIDRQFSSGLMAIATAAKQIVDDGMQIIVGGGLESISLVQNENRNRHQRSVANRRIWLRPVSTPGSGPPGALVHECPDNDRHSA